MAFWNRKQPQIVEPVKLYSGTAVQTEDGFFFIKNGVRIQIPNKKIVHSWRFPRVLKCSETAVSHYPKLGKLGFRDGTLLYCQDNGNYYMISERRRHKLSVPSQLKEMCISASEAIWCTQEELDLHKEGS